MCVVIAAVHVEDQGGITAFTDPGWLGWAYRLLTIGAVAVAGHWSASLEPVPVRAPELAAAAAQCGRLRLGWTAAALIGLGPLLGYVFSRTTGLPGSADDIGNWGEPLGVVSMVVEGALVLLAVAALLALRTDRQPITAPLRLASPPDTGEPVGSVVHMLDHPTPPARSRGVA